MTGKFVSMSLTVPLPHEKSNRIHRSPKEPDSHTQTWADKVKSNQHVNMPSKHVPAVSKSPNLGFRLLTAADARQFVTRVNQLRTALENGQRPVATMVATSHEQASELKLLVQAQDLTDIKVAAVLLYGPCPESLESKWAHVS